MNSLTTHLTSGISRVFRRYQARFLQPPTTDEWGFVEESSDVVGFDTLIPFQAILVVGPPWVGKTFVAEQIRTLNILDGDQFSTKLHHHSIGLPLQASGWNNWSSSDRGATWIIDSLDEGELIQENIHQMVLRDLHSLEPTARARLRVIVFCREANLPEPFLDGLADLYGDEFIAVELLALTQDGARRMLGKATFSRVLEKIQQHQLHGAAQFPAPLKYIEGHLDEPLTKAAIWEGVLKELLDEKSEQKQKRAFNDPEIEERFRAASHLACVMTFTGIDRIAVGGRDANGAPLHELIRETPPGVGPTRSAARRALESTMFTGGRFSQKHLCEWMCAFALKDMVIGRLKVLLTEPGSNLTPGHMGVLSLLAQIGKPELRDWIITKNGGVLPRSDQPVSVTDTRQILDHLERIADTSPWSLRFWNEPSVIELRVFPSLGKEVAHRLHNRQLSSARRILLLQIAAITDLRLAVEPAIELLRNPNLTHDVIEAALVVVKRLANTSQLVGLNEFVQTSRPRSRVRKATVSAIIQRYLDEGLWRIEDAVRFAPEPHDDVVDSTYMLEKTLIDQLTVPAARIVIERLLPTALSASESEVFDSHHRESLLDRAISLILKQELPTDSDLDALVPLAIRQWENACREFDFNSGFRKSESSRRKLYLAELQYHRDRKNTSGRGCRWVLLPDDVEWLIEQLPTLANDDDQVWEDVLIAANQSNEEEVRQRARVFVEGHRPAVVRHLDEGVAWHRKWKEERLAQDEEAARAQAQREVDIREYTAAILSKAEWSLQHKMWALSEICFYTDHGRPTNLVGTWDDLDVGVRDQILNVCVSAIRDCPPTFIPAMDRVPRSVLFEAWCFRAVLTHRPQEVQLNAGLIEKWLPALLHWTIYWDASTIDRCLQADRDTTEQVFLGAIQRELRLGSRHAVTAANMPSQLWTASFRDKLVAWTANPEFNSDSRADLLDRIADREPSSAMSVARELIKSETESNLGKTALDLLLRYSPNDAWPKVQSDFKAGQLGALLSLGQLYDIRDRATFDEWPAERLVELVSMLLSAFPQSSDPDGLHGWVTPEMLCRQLRDAIPTILFHRGGTEDRTLLARFVTEQPQLKPWLDRAIAEENARRILVVPTSQFLPLGTVLDALANADYRFVRHADDLIEVIQEQLKVIVATVGEDIELFYRKRDRSLQDEGTLQAYFLRRLSDRLPGRVLAPNATAIDLSREHQGKLLRRKDILVRATSIDGNQHEVVIEVKWSSNRETLTSLVEQLGDQYLCAEGRTHGIYLVAWNGRVPALKRRGKQAARQTFEELQSWLDDQAKKYNGSHSNVQIRPVVFDLAWPTRKARKKVGRSSKSSSLTKTTTRKKRSNTRKKS